MENMAFREIWKKYEDDIVESYEKYYGFDTIPREYIDLLLDKNFKFEEIVNCLNNNKLDDIFDINESSVNEVYDFVEEIVEIINGYISINNGIASIQPDVQKNNDDLSKIQNNINDMSYEDFISKGHFINDNIVYYKEVQGNNLSNETVFVSYIDDFKDGKIQGTSEYSSSPIQNSNFQRPPIISQPAKEESSNSILNNIPENYKDSVSKSKNVVEEEYVDFSKIRVGNKISGLVRLKITSVAKAKNGKNYLNATFVDISGKEMIGRKFSYSGTQTDYDDCLSKIVYLEATCSEFQGVTNLLISSIERRNDLNKEIEIKNDTSTNIDDLLIRLNKLMSVLGIFKPLIEELLINQNYLSRMKDLPAGIKFHDYRKGGLLNHTIKVAETTYELSVRYGADISLAVSGALLHDIGKSIELAEDNGAFVYTIEGSMLGHALLGCSIIQKAFDKIKTNCEINDIDLMHLLHIIASHHGDLEKEAVKNPYSLEALLVHYADETDAILTNWIENKPLVTNKMTFGLKNIAMVAYK